MMLEAVWFNNGKEVFKVSPVMNIVCDDEMKSVDEIEIFDGNEWYSSELCNIEANDFEIRIKARKNKKG